MSACNNRKFPENNAESLGLMRTHKDSLIIVYTESSSAITKYITKESNDTLYIRVLYTGDKAIDTSIPISSKIKYVNLQNLFTQHIDSVMRWCDE